MLTPFYVDHGNGLRSYFGETSNARAPASGFARTWHLSRTVDPFGNEIEYSYWHPTANETLPQTVTWTRNDGESLPPRYAVTIAYENRPADDQRSGYDAFGLWARTQRIDEIDVTYDDGTTVHDIATYALTYDRPAGFTDVSYHVCASGGCFAPHAAFYVRTADSTGATSYTFLDAFERPVGSDSPLAGGKRSREQIRYLENGRVDERSLPYVAGEGVHWVTVTYDALGRTLTEADETGTTATYEYLGHALEVTDGKNHLTHYEHNALGQIAEVIDAMGGTTAYAYHPFGELHTVTDDDTNVTTIEYDARGLKTHLYDPDMGHWQYDHNAYGELVWQKDAKNQEVALEYDDAGRLAERIEAEGTTYFTFYPHNAPTAGHAGRLQQVPSPNNLAEVFEFDPDNGAVAEIVRTIGAASYELDFAYDDHGRLEVLTYPQNVHAQRFAVEYVFDGWGALSQVRNAATPSEVFYTLNEQNGSGAARRATLGNGLVEQYGYQPTTGLLASIKTGPNGSATLQNLEYEWDLAGNLEERVDQLLSRTEVFGYDALDRLQTVTRNSSPVFNVTYDALGNIKTKTGVTGTYSYGAGSAGPHAVTSIGSSMTFAYNDANGNMTDRNGDEIDWTSYNLPSRIEAPGGEYSTFSYGHDRSRYVQTEVAGSLTRTRHYASPGLFEVTWDNGAARMDYHYIHANGGAVAQLTTSSGGDVLQYLHRDHQGSVVATSASNGTLLDRFEYDPFGRRDTTVGSDELSPRGYTAHEHLVAPDLIHMNGRVQDPLLGRFLSPDPLVQAPYHSQSLNRYSYVWNNPLTLVDPSGFETCANGEDDHGTGGYLCGDICLFYVSCEGLDFKEQLWIAEEFGLEQRQPAFIFDPPAQVAQPVSAAASVITAPIVAMGSVGQLVLDNPWTNAPTTAPPTQVRPWLQASTSVLARAAVLTGGLLFPSNGLWNDKPGECYGTLTCAANPVYNESGKNASETASDSLSVSGEPASAPPADPEEYAGPRRARAAVRRGQGPSGISRIDPPNSSVRGSQWEAHTGGKGSPALRKDGTWKHVSPDQRPPDLPRATREWLREYGWKLCLATELRESSLLCSTKQMFVIWIGSIHYRSLMRFRYFLEHQTSRFY